MTFSPSSTHKYLGLLRLPFHLTVPEHCDDEGIVNPRTTVEREMTARRIGLIMGARVDRGLKSRRYEGGGHTWVLFRARGNPPKARLERSANSEALHPKFFCRTVKGHSDCRHLREDFELPTAQEFFLLGEVRVQHASGSVPAPPKFGGARLAAFLGGVLPQIRFNRADTCSRSVLPFGPQPPSGIGTDSEGPRFPLADAAIAQDGCCPLFDG